MPRVWSILFAIPIIAACSSSTDTGETTTPTLVAPCTEGDACTCPDRSQGIQSCQSDGAEGMCTCPDGSKTRLGERESPPPDAVPPAPPASAPDGDTCAAASLGKVPIRDVTRGAETIFSAELDGATDTFRSSCVRAEGPDIIQPLRIKTTGTLVVAVETTAAFVGTPVIYLKATCNDTRDVGCNATQGRIRVPVEADRTYFLHIDSVAKAHAQGARVTLRAEIE